jgi:hypothetical protein
MYSATARAAEAHTGQHLQGCITCTAVVDAEARGLRVPAIGERVVMDVTLLGEVYAVEVIVAEVSVNAARVLQVIGRPEGTLVTAFARTEWREVGS